MLPKTTWRITAPPLRRYASRATKTVPDIGTDTRTHTHTDSLPSPAREQHYDCAGPSRLPFCDKNGLNDAAPPVTASSPSLASSSISTRRISRDSARTLRQALKSIDTPIAFQNPTRLLKYAGRISGDPQMFYRRLSRLEKHVVLHEMIRKRMGLLGTRYARRFVRERQSPQFDRHDSAMSLRTLDKLFVKEGFKQLRQLRLHLVDNRPPRPEPLPQPTMDEQRPHNVSAVLETLIQLLEAFKEEHHPRPAALYSLIIKQCLRENRPDEAARVYATLVEDWVMEGRVAEGANPEDFGPSGIPAHDRETSVSSRSLFDVWFGSVRTWRLPGEAMSLHDRLDLWHPNHAAPDERLRGFPIPIATSPPSHVPQPTTELLTEILDYLYLDPRKATPAEYASSMRALATLANTILSRSLPIPAIPRLLKVFSQSHTHPAVFPESYTQVPEINPWAYTASTQVHVALMSLMFSPPNYTRAHEIEEESADNPLPSPAGAARYALHPLGLQSCLVLVNYAAKQLKQPRLLSRLLQYMKGTFVEWPTLMFNGLFRSSTLTQDDRLATEVEQSLFKNTPLSAERVRQTAEAIGNRPKGDESKVQRAASVILDLPEGNADSQSVVALIMHLVATSQFDRLRDTVHVLIPFLSTNYATTPEEIRRIAALTGAKIGPSGRLQPSELSPQLYAVIINGLAKGGFVGLAQRVYFIATTMEKRYLNRAVEQAEQQAVEQRLNPAEAIVPLSTLEPIRLPIDVYTTMLYLYGQEVRKSGERKGWIVPKMFGLLSRNEAARAMAKHMYAHVGLRWKELNASEREALAKTLPDAHFFNMAIFALSPQWEMSRAEPLHHTHEAEVNHIIRDMTELGIDPPVGLLEKLNEPHIVTSSFYLPTRTTHNASPEVTPEVYLPVVQVLDRHVDFLSEELPSKVDEDQSSLSEAEAINSARPDQPTSTDPKQTGPTTFASTTSS